MQPFGDPRYSHEKGRSEKMMQPKLKRLSAVMVIVLFSLMTLHSSTIALAQDRSDDWKRQSMIIAGGAGGGAAVGGMLGGKKGAAVGALAGGLGATAYELSKRDQDFSGERSKTTSAMIIAGSSGAGAAIGGLTAGRKGAIIGAIAGGVGGYIYDRKTNNR
jgi:hypothetical protein